MAVGGINLRTSRRVNFNKCAYWNRKDKDVDKEEYAHNNAVNGYFYAKEVSPITKNKNVVNGLFMVDRNQTTLYTTDRINIESGDIVKYNDDLWRVVDIQEVPIKKQSQFMHQVDCETYLQLVK